MEQTKMLKKKAVQIRKMVLEMIYRAKSGHTGGSLSCVEILLSLFYGVMQIDPKNPKL
ncbi:MAG: transketolase, partial [Pseudothermotoga sp.]|nr:transketolase [Pseudothermotoga sp.]